MVEYFPGQKPDEQMRVLARPYWMAMIWQILAFALLSVLPIAILVVLAATGTPPFEGTTGAITAVGLPAYYLILVTWFFVVWLDYYLDVGIVTDERVVDIDQAGLFKRNIAELECGMVQDVTSDKRGVLQTVFDFGDVVIQTAGERANFEFKGIRHPDLVVNQIREAVKGRDEDPGTAAGKMSQAAEKLSEVAEHIQKDDAPAEPTPKPPTPPPNATPQPDTPPDQPDDLPREYER